MSYNLRPTEPSWETAHRCLPQEYTERSDLYNSDITSKASMDPSEKWNILLIKRMELFSEQGYVTTDEYKNSTRVWAAFYFGENNEPNGIVLSMVANDFFYAWKGRVLSPEKTIQSVTWTKEKGFSFEIFKKDGRFPAILKNALFDKHVTEDVELNCEIQTITSVEKEKLMEFCGNSRPHFPSNVEKELFPEEPRTTGPNIAYYVAGAIAIIAITILVSRYFKQTPAENQPSNRGSLN